MNDTTSPKHPPPSHDQEPPDASHAQCGNHAECFERLRDSIVSWFMDNFGAGNVTVIPPGARLLVHLPPDAMDRPLLWSKVLGDVADLLDVRVAAVCNGVDVTVVTDPQSTQADVMWPDWLGDHMTPEQRQSFEQLKNCMAPPTTMADESERIVAKEALRRLALAATAGSKT